MEFKFNHNSINVLDLDKSLKFYKDLLGLEPVKVKEASDGSFKLVFLGDKDGSLHRLELTWLRDRKEPYNLGDNEMHLAFTADDFQAAYEFHKAAGVVCFENPSMGIYFISDPDGYWLEVVPKK